MRDTSGAVLPGVTVEAASPALIEQVRVGVSDGNGQFRVIDLRPGVYTVTFSLPGFAVIRREGIELSGAFTATLNVEMRVGGLEETITVTGQSPIVDVQSARQQQVVSKDVLDAVPSARTHIAMAVLVPAVGLASGTSGANQDVGGTRGDAMTALVAHGSRSSDQRVVLDGLATNNDSATGARTGFQPNMSSTQEIVIDVAAGGADQPTGGVRINIIPREGGNTFSGTVFYTGANSSFQGSNYSQELKDRGLTTPSSLKKMYDFNPGMGGPVFRNKLWFFMAGRRNVYENYVGESYENKNSLEAWTYEPDLSRPVTYPQEFWNVNGRLTLQVAEKHKLSGFYQSDYRCQCPRATGGSTTEASIHFRLPLQRVAQVAWSSPVTNRLLFDVAVGNRGERWMHAEGGGGFNIGVTDQFWGVSYRGRTGNQGFATSLNGVTNVRAAMSYVPGTHSFKVGVDFKRAFRHHWTYLNNPASVNYRFNNGVPNQITQYAAPFDARTDNPIDLAIYAQDSWTLDRLTLYGGLRFERFTTSFPEQQVGPGPLVPTRTLSFPARSFADWKDFVPRIGVAYDLFGGGRTAVKASLNKYMVATGIGTGSVFGNNGNPVFNMANEVTRSWNDGNRNYHPDCDLLNPLANGECGRISDLNFGLPRSATLYDPETYLGWGTRPYNWEFSAGVQHELIPGVSVNAGYFDRWYGNQIVTDNRATSVSDYDVFSVTAPADPRLPGGGGYVVSGLYNVNPDKLGQVDNYLTFSSTYGKDSERWRGVDVGLMTRFAADLLFQGGLSMGRTVRDNCEVRAKVPEIALTNPYCHVAENLQTNVKFVASYTIPRVAVQASAAFQSFPGTPVVANFVASNAVVRPSLGRNLAGGASSVTVNLIEPGTQYGDRINQLDLRFGKILRFGTARSTLSLDLYNALNAAPVLTENSSYARFREPRQTNQARLARISLQFDF
ncbi:MAG: TonB-dependent receptor [Acidobacteria bacterium]|nr:TonB-dependent receptor [Acidobacteriota bacterium]